MSDRIVTEIMTSDVVAVTGDTTVAEAARLMRDEQIGNVVVVQDGSVRGLVTDRDIVLRVVAEQRDPVQVDVEEICSEPVAVLTAQDTATTAIEQMRQSAIRRLPVVDDDGALLGILSIGDLAALIEVGSLLAEISAAPPTMNDSGDGVPQQRSESTAKSADATTG